MTQVLPELVTEIPLAPLGPQYPDSIPQPDPPIIQVARQYRQSWDHVWELGKSLSHVWVQQASGDVGRAIDLLVPVIEAYVGTSQKILGGYINQLGEYTRQLATQQSQTTQQFAGWTEQNLRHVALVLYGALVKINLLEGVIPQLEAAIFRSFDYAHDVAHEVGLNVETWTMNHVYDPLYQDLRQLNQDLVRYIDAKAEAVIDGMNDVVDSKLAPVTALATLAVGAAAQTKQWVDECGAPMCDTMGPKTDLGKLFKAFELAGILALLMEIGNMTEADVEARLRELAGQAQGIVSAFEGTFVGGGGSLHDFALSLL